MNESPQALEKLAWRKRRNHIAIWLENFTREIAEENSIEMIPYTAETYEGFLPDADSLLDYLQRANCKPLGESNKSQGDQ
jgi:hypothetical protein